MSKDTPAATPHHRPTNSALAELRGIPVAQLKFHDLFEVPGHITTTGMKSEREQTNKARSVITYLPQLACFQLDFYPPASKEIARTIMVDKAHVNWWEPAA